jgi:hypothetical protein
VRCWPSSRHSRKLTQNSVVPSGEQRTSALAAETFEKFRRLAQQPDHK